MLAHHTLCLPAPACAGAYLLARDSLCAQANVVDDTSGTTCKVYEALKYIVAHYEVRRPRQPPPAPTAAPAFAGAIGAAL